MNRPFVSLSLQCNPLDKLTLALCQCSFKVTTNLSKALFYRQLTTYLQNNSIIAKTDNALLIIPETKWLKLKIRNCLTLFLGN